MKRLISMFVLISALGLTSSSFRMIDKVEDPLVTCNPPTLLFYDPSTGFLVSGPLCRFITYEVVPSGTVNAIVTSISGGTLEGKNGCDLPGCEWRIRPTTTSGMTIQIYGQCYIGGQLVNSSVMTYNYVVNICPK
jgi:hypothetical protein